MKRRHAQHAISEDEQIARYAYVLGNVPASVADKAYAAAYSRLSPSQRQDLVGRLGSQVSDRTAGSGIRRSRGIRRAHA